MDRQREAATGGEVWYVDFVARVASREPFAVPIRIMVTPEYPETEVVKFARAALHVVMASLANQTTPWRIAAES